MCNGQCDRCASTLTYQHHLQRVHLNKGTGTSNVIELAHDADLDLAAGADIVAHAEGHPLVWLQATESGRAVVNLLGHDHQSLAEPNHRQLNGQLLDWLLRN